MRNAFIRRTATGRLGRSTKGNARGQDRLRRAAPLPIGINNNKDLEIDNIAVTLRLAPTPMLSIDTAQ
jgi:hypothetical protein